MIYQNLKFWLWEILIKIYPNFMNIVVCLFPLTAVLPEKHDDGQQAEDLSHAIQLSSLKYDFILFFNFSGEDQLKLIFKTKLLGVSIIFDLTFTRHVEEIS